MARKKINLRINWNVTDSKIVDATPLNRYFAVHRSATGDTTKWVITHIRTGYRACFAPSLPIAQRVADQLVRTFGAKAWQFDKPDASNMVRFKNAPALIYRLKCWR